MPREALAWRELDGEVVVRNAQTGSTHLLAPFARDVLQVLLESDAPLSAADVTAGLIERLPEAEGSSDEVERLLDGFERLGLAVRASGSP